MPKQDEPTGYYEQNKNATKPGRGVSRREMEKGRVEDEQRRQQYNRDWNVEPTHENAQIGFDWKNIQTIYKLPPKQLMYDTGNKNINKRNPKDIDTPQPQMSPVKRQAKAAERQRMKTPGMGDVKAAERRETKPKSAGSILYNQMMKQQGKK